MNGNLGLMIKSCHFIIGKGNELSSLKQCFGHESSHACKMPSPNHLCLTIGFWKILDMQQLAHVFKITHGPLHATCHQQVSQHVETSKKLH
jgi:hypothetical protein